MIAKIYSWLVSPKGLALDRYLVRYTGQSLLIRAFAWQSGIEPAPALLLRTRGRKTGLWRDAVLPWFGDSAARVVVASNGGLPTDPAWARNLREHAEAEVFVNRELQTVRARLAEGKEYENLWSRISAEVPAYREYQDSCGDKRRIPLLILETT